MLAKVGPHDDLWIEAASSRSTETHVQVPIRAGTARWGSVELRFQPLGNAGLRGWLGQTPVRLTIFVTAASYLCFLVYMGRMLAHLDPSRPCPSACGQHWIRWPKGCW